MTADGPNVHPPSPARELVSDGDAQDAREAEGSWWAEEGCHEGDCDFYGDDDHEGADPDVWPCSHAVWVPTRFERAIADAELAPLRARVAELEAEVEGWKAAERRMAGMYDRAADQAVAAEAERNAIRQAVEALLDEWLIGHGVSGPSWPYVEGRLRAALAAAGPAVSDGEGATIPEAVWHEWHGDREGATSEAPPYPGDWVWSAHDRPASPVVAPSATDEGGGDRG